MYSSSDVARLYEILVLRRMGLGLAAIREQLESPRDLRDVVAEHLVHTRETIAAQQRLVERLERVAASLEVGQLASEALLRVMEDMMTLEKFLDTTLDSTNFAFLGSRYQGKVRDVYDEGDRIVLISTDRQSAFDYDWTTIPLKGQALNQISAWWFERVADVMPTQVIDVPDPNVTIAKKLKMLKIEVVVRAYLTGSTSTSAWVHYQNGSRNFCGNPLPDGMRKNQKLDEIIFTPSTKPETGHDISASPDELVALGLITKEEIDEVKEKAFALFRRGQQVALERGLILVDTKYEMGYDANGVLTVGDEVHTPDSSRYWIAASYEERFANGQEPESLDKEFFRLWLQQQGFVDDGRPKPEVTDEARVMLASKYIELYERVTGQTFEVPSDPDVPKRIEENLKRHAAGEAVTSR